MPFAWYPAALVQAAIYSGLTPLGIRLAGIAVAFASVGVLWYLAPAIFPALNTRLRCVAAVAAILSFGVLPWTLVLARPEQWIIVLIAVFLAFPALAARAVSHQRSWNSWSMLALFMLLTSLISYSHTKALFFVPFVVVSAYCAFRRQPWLLALAVTFSIVSAWQSFQFASAVSRCDDAPHLTELLRQQTLNPAALLTSPGEFIGDAVANVMSAPGKIVERARFKSRYQSDWLPPVPAAASHPLVRRSNIAITWALHVIYGLAVLLPPIVMVLWRRTEPDHRARNVLFGALWLGFLAHIAIYREWNFYGGALVFVIAGLLLIHCAALLQSVPAARRSAATLLAGVCAASLLSTPVLAYQMVPRLFDLTQAADEVLSRQPLSVNAFAFGKTKQRIRGLAAACGVDGDGGRRLVVDSLTYFAFDDLRQPLHAGFIWPGGPGADIAGRTGSFLAEIGSAGYVAQCQFLPPELGNLTFRDGNLCCVNLKAVYVR